MNLSFCLSDSRLLGRLAISLTVSLTISVNPALAESLAHTVINGLFTPTQSDRFFKEGRLKLESETKILTNPQYSANDDLLQITPELLEQRKYPNYFDLETEDSVSDYDSSWE